MFPVTCELTQKSYKSNIKNSNKGGSSGKITVRILSVDNARVMRIIGSATTRASLIIMCMCVNICDIVAKNRG